MSFMLVIKTKVQIDRIIVLYFLSCVFILQNIFFNYQVFEIGSSQRASEFWNGRSVVGGSVGWWVSRRWSVGRWSVDLIKTTSQPAIEVNPPNKIGIEALTHVRSPIFSGFVTTNLFLSKSCSFLFYTKQS